MGTRKQEKHPDSETVRLRRFPATAWNQPGSGSSALANRSRGETRRRADFSEPAGGYRSEFGCVRPLGAQEDGEGGTETLPVFCITVPGGLQPSVLRRVDSHPMNT